MAVAHPAPIPDDRAAEVRAEALLRALKRWLESVGWTIRVQPGHVAAHVVADPMRRSLTISATAYKNWSAGDVLERVLRELAGVISEPLPAALAEVRR